MTLAETLILLAAIGGTGWLVAMFGWLWHRLRRLEDALGPTGTGHDRLQEDVGLLRADLLDGLDRMNSVGERLDFMERLLGEPGAQRTIAPSRENPPGESP